MIDEVGELVITEPMPSMPVFFWGDEDGSATAPATRALSGDLAPRRLDRDHLARHGDHLRPLGLDDQPRRCPDGHQRDLPRRLRRRRGTRLAGRRCPEAGHRGWMPLFVVLREGVELDDELVDRIRRSIRECSPGTSPRAFAEVPRTLSGKVLEVPVKRILMGDPPRRRRAATPWRTPPPSTTSRSSQAASEQRVRGRVTIPGERA